MSPHPRHQTHLQPKAPVTTHPHPQVWCPHPLMATCRPIPSSSVAKAILVSGTSHSEAVYSALHNTERNQVSVSLNKDIYSGYGPNVRWTPPLAFCLLHCFLWMLNSCCRPTVILRWISLCLSLKSVHN